MNTQLIMNSVKSDREYSAILKAHKITEKVKLKHPLIVSGIAEGADDIFRCTLTDDLLKNGDCVLLIYPDDMEAGNAADYLNSFGINAFRYPSKDFNFNNMTASHDFENERLSVIARLNGYGDGEPFAICAGISAVLQFTMPAAVLHETTLVIDGSTEIDTTEFAEKLISAGYKKVDIVEGAGQFALRGGILDVYTPLGFAYRVELFGDEIDRMGTFDIESQRFKDFCDGEIVIPPARELIISEKARSDIAETVKYQIKKLDKSSDAEEADRARKLLKEELSDIENGNELQFADKYIPIIYSESVSLFDMFDGTAILASPAELEGRVSAAEMLLDQSITDMLEHMELPQFRNLAKGYMASWAAVISRLKQISSVLIDTLARVPEGVSSGGEFDMETRHISSYSARCELFEEDVRSYVSRGWTVYSVFETETEMNSIIEELVDNGITAANGDKLDVNAKLDGGCVIGLVGHISGGFELPRNKFALLDYSGGTGKKKSARILKKHAKKKSTEAIMSYADLMVGDLVVHSAYGIGQYMGLENLTVAGISRDYVSIKYAGTDQLFLPVDQLDLVSKYIGAGSESGSVKLSKMGGADWKKAKSKAKAATKEMAKELIELYAARKRAKGISFAPDDEMCREFADSFEYVETDGQLAAIDDVRRDMEESYPMDRLVCGDVGYGKTEVALRAAFKAVMSGKQVALLVPTTILAYQHFKNFKSRMRAFPVNVDLLSRFRSPSEQKASLRKLKRGETDIIIGTHRLISNDIEFSDLGLVIIDEEQRFGVAQKEKLKKLCTGVDVLTLTATPIPRTLNMAMGGIVDMSLLDEAPGMRAPVQTYVLEYDEQIIYEAIRRELRRSGQVFYMYNRVEGIYNVAGRISKAIPDARVAVAHGKMDKDEMEDIWESLIKGEVDILVCTTIIETGVDIPNANTLIIENADMYGLSQLHQIRGRVGRSGRRAYAYFTYKKNKSISEVAEKRLAAIKEYAQFGAGFKIALRDLEIRGAGNLLGSEQHGHIETVGYDLYMKLLNEAVIEEKGEDIPKRTECSIDVEADAYLSKSYIPFAPQRMDLYKKIARIGCEEDYEDMIDEMCDRFGEPGTPAINLCRIALIKSMAASSGVKQVVEHAGQVRFIPEQINSKALTSLASKFNTSRMRVVAGGEPAVTCIVPKGKRNLDFLMDMFSEYKKLMTT